MIPYLFLILALPGVLLLAAVVMTILLGKDVPDREIQAPACANPLDDVPAATAPDSAGVDEPSQPEP